MAPTKKTALISIVAVALIMTIAGCGNPFGSSSTGNRYTPVISDLVISKKTIFCNHSFTFKFSYRDPQGDIDRVFLVISGNDNTGYIEEEFAWTDTEVDTKTEPGKAIVTYTIECSDEMPDGSYTLRVYVKDKKNHTSSSLLEEFALF